ncbi:MAG: cytochrome c biogenesis protein CcdA, partial [Sphingobacterium sp.]
MYSLKKSFFATCWFFLLLTIPIVGFSQDTLINFDEVEFTDSQTTPDTSVLENGLIDFEDVEFTDGTDTTLDQGSNEASTDSIQTASTEDAPSLWGIFIEGLLGGFLAFLMPCIFPMVPLTVSFFTKKSATKLKAVSQALTYGLFIIVIYVALGMLITISFGPEALNALSTNG